MIADLCIKHDVLCISDEVYEWLTYDGNKHVKIGEIQSEANKMHTKHNAALLFVLTMLLTASLPGMWERTITIGSGGKTFSATGWKVTPLKY